MTTINHIEEEETQTKLFASCRRGDLKNVIHLVDELRVNVNLEGPESYTPLHCAVVSGNIQLVRYLISRGANVCKLTKRDDLSKKEIDESPVTLARKLERFEVARELIQPKAIDQIQLQVFNNCKFDENQIISRGTCSICLDDVDLIALSMCSHSFCSDCLTSWFTEQLKEGNHICKCPQSDCKMIVNYLDTIRFVNDQKVLSWFENHCIEALLSTLDDCRTCPKCGVIGFLDDQNCKSVKCSACDYSFCATCLNEDHPLISCKKKAMITYTSEQLSRMDEYSQEWIESNAKNCPQCRTPIQHGGACSHMTCKRCSYQFCYVCLGKYVGRHVYDMKGPCTCNPQSNNPS